MTEKFILFDLDGVIADSERLKGQAFTEACRYYGGKISSEFYPTVIGQPGEEVIKAFIKASGANVNASECIQRFKQVYRKLLKQHIKAVPGAGDLLRTLKEHDWKVGLVSSSGREALNYIVDQLGFRGYFNDIVSAKDVQKHKPAPDLYLKAMERMNIKPENGLAIEDTESGIAAAQSAGLKVIALKHDLNNRHDFSKANLVIDSLEPPKKVLKAIQDLLKF